MVRQCSFFIKNNDSEKKLPYYLQKDDRRFFREKKITHRI